MHLDLKTADQKVPQIPHFDTAPLKQNQDQGFWIFRELFKKYLKNQTLDHIPSPLRFAITNHRLRPSKSTTTTPF